MKFPPSHLQSQTSKPLGRVGFGGAALSGEGGGYGFGEMSEKNAEELLDFSWNEGITLYDTAPIYGFGLSEERMGRYLPKEAFIVTKGGVSWHASRRVNMSNDPKIIETMFFESLKRLNRDFIDVYMIHWPDSKVDIRAPLELLESLRKRGLIKSLGLCNTNKDDLTKAETVTQIDYLQSEFNLFQPHSFDDLSSENKFSMGWGTFDKGILTGRVQAGRSYKPEDARSWAPWWNKKAVEEKVKKVSLFKTVLDQHNISLMQFNVQFALGHIDCALVGSKSKEDLKVIIEAAKAPLSADSLQTLTDEWKKINL